MEKKILIWLSAALAVLLLALCVILTVTRPDTSGPSVETTTDLAGESATTEAGSTTTDPAGESAATDDNPTTVDPTEGHGEPDNQTTLDIVDNEISIDDLLNPDNGNDEDPFGGMPDDDVFSEDTTEETEPDTTKEAGNEITATTEATEDTNVTETTQPNVTEVSNDGYSNNWY